MRIDVRAILLILAIVCFLFSAFGVAWSQSKVNLMAAGLFFATLALLIGTG